MTADELRQKRIALNLTQEQMAGAINTPYGTYVQWEQGRYRIPPATALTIAALRKSEHIS